MIDTLLTALNSLKRTCLDMDSFIDRLRFYVPDGDEDYCRLIEANKKLVKEIDGLIAGINRVKEKIK
jgi:hypothetical protein